MEPVFRKRIRGRIGIDGKNEYTALKPTHIQKYNDVISIPVNENGLYDYDMQKKLADRFNEINQIKESVKKTINKLLEIDIV